MLVARILMEDWLTSIVVHENGGDHARLVRQNPESTPDANNKGWLRKFQHKTKVGHRGINPNLTINISRVECHDKNNINWLTWSIPESNALGVVRPAPLSSQMSIIGDRSSLENVTDWRIVVKQYIANNLANWKKTHSLNNSKISIWKLLWDFIYLKNYGTMYRFKISTFSTTRVLTKSCIQSSSTLRIFFVQKFKHWQW